MIVVCAWCLPQRVVLQDDGVEDGRVSHGMCDKHMAQWIAEFKLTHAPIEEARSPDNGPPRAAGETRGADEDAIESDERGATE